MAPYPQDRLIRSVTVLEDGTARPLVPGTVVELRLSADRLSAHAGGNTLGASLSIEQDRLVVGPVWSTRMYPGPDRTRQDEWLAAFLSSGPEWTLVGDRLRLTSGPTTIEFSDAGLSPPS